MTKPFRLGVVFTHPTQHHSPLWRHLSEDPNLDVHVMYLSAENTLKGSGDRELGATEPWDIDLLSGYKNEFLKDISGKISPNVKKNLLNPQLLNRLKSNEFDAVYVSSFVTYSHRLAFLLCKIHKIPIISFNDGTIITQNSYYQPIKRTILSFIYPYLLNLTDYWMVTGDHNAIYLRHYAVSDNKMTKGNFPFDRQRFENQISDNKDSIRAVRKRYSHRDDSVIFGFAGKYIDRKKPFDFINGIIAAHKIDSRVKGVLIGGGILNEEINRKISEHSDKLLNIGFVNQSQLPLYYAAMDVFISTSSIDPHPLVVSEAMAAGCPVILSDHCGNWGYSDILQHRYNGIVFPCGDIQKLTEAIIHLSDTDNRKQYSLRAREIVATQDLDQTVKSLKIIIDKIKDSKNAA